MADLFTATEIAELHADWVSALVSTCTITNPGTGNAVTTRCAVTKRTRQTMQGGAATPMDRQVDDTIWLPLGTDIAPGYVIVADGVRYMAGEVIFAGTTYDHGIAVEVTREAA